MSLLLDSHTSIWFILNDKRLPAKTKSLIEEADFCLLSICSIWEMKIKNNLGKLELNKNFNVFLELITQSKVDILELRSNHIVQLDNLKKIHKDPFDRIIIAQAITEKLTIITKDTIFKKYPVKTFWK